MVPSAVLMKLSYILEKSFHLSKLYVLFSELTCLPFLFSLLWSDPCSELGLAAPSSSLPAVAVPAKRGSTEPALQEPRSWGGAAGALGMAEGILLGAPGSPPTAVCCETY